MRHRTQVPRSFAECPSTFVVPDASPSRPLVAEPSPAAVPATAAAADAGRHAHAPSATSSAAEAPSDAQGVSGSPAATPAADMPGWTARLADAGRAALRELTVLRAAAMDPRTPRRVRWALALLALYLASPVDLIPDFIPVLGQLDDAALALIVIRWARRRIPDAVLAEHRASHP